MSYNSVSEGSPAVTLASAVSLDGSTTDLQETVRRRSGFEVLLVHIPQSAQKILASTTAAVVYAEGLEKTWFADFPRIVGHFPVVDAALQSIVLASQRHLHGRDNLAQSQHALAHAFDLLRRSVASGSVGDDCLLALACLAPRDSGMQKRNNMIITSHLDGMVAMVKARSDLGLLASDLVSRVVQYYSFDIFLISVVRAKPSPLENIHHTHYKSASQQASPAVSRLHEINDKLAVHLPRLINLVRDLRKQVGRSRACLTALIKAVVDSASLLLQERDDDAETILLRGIGVKLNADASDRKVMKYSFHYGRISDFDAVTRYWLYRVTLLRLCCTIFPRLLIPDDDTALSESAPCRWISQHSSADMTRYAKNLIMSIRFCRSLKPRAKRRLYGHMLVTLWAVTVSQLGCDELASREYESSYTRSWLMENARLVFGTFLSERDMDEAADLSVGGSCTGIYADMLR
jgi:hypothetical protein